MLELLPEPPRIVKKSSSFSQISSPALPGGNVREKMTNPIVDEEEWCHVRSGNIDSAERSLWENTEGYNVENILLYLIDINILSGEQVRWNKICRNLDLSQDPGPVRDSMLELEEEDQQPSTSMQSSSNKEIEETGVDLQDEDDPSEKVVRALMSYFKNKNNANVEPLMHIPYIIDAPENLLQIYRRLPEAPNEFYIVDGEEVRLRNDWRPPRKTFIFELVDFQYDVSTLLSRQNNSCAGCGLRFQKRRTNYCQYYNQFFCQLCFQGQTSRIPARILHKWDFKEYPVSDIAHKFLKDNESQPVFDIHIIEPSLFRKVKNLRLIRSLRIKICHLWEYIKRCSSATECMTKYGILKTMFESIPSRFLDAEFNFMYSILDFCSIENGNLIEMLRPLELYGSSHVTKCSICIQRGFLCQICVSPDKIIFPFQLEKIFRCTACGDLVHLSCYKKTMSAKRAWTCARCDRIRKKRMIQQRRFESSNSD